jgi:cobyrinic acid a,c-diamide synthase
MSVPRLILAGLEPGPALELAANALLAALGEQHRTHVLLLGLDVRLWSLLYESAERAPRVIDPALHDQAVTDELCSYWAENSDLCIYIAARPALDRWEGVEDSRPVDFARRLDAPLVLVLDARDRGATAAAAAYGVRALAGRADVSGLIVVGADEASSGELLAALRRDVDLPILGRIPPQLSEQFVRQRAVSTGTVRTFGPKPERGSEQRLCHEAASYLQADELLAVAARRGYLPAVQRRIFAPDTAAAGLRLAVAWGPPLQPLALENVDVLQALGVELVPLHVGRDRVLPPDVNGLLLSGQLDEEQLAVFSGNGELLGELAEKVGDGLPTLALGGGCLLLLRRLADSRGRSYDMAGVIPAEAELIEWYDRPHYVRAAATRVNPYDEGDNVLYELFDLEFLVLEQETFAYRVSTGGADVAEGFAVGRCLATTLYPSFPLSPGMAARFIAAMRMAGSWR